MLLLHVCCTDCTLKLTDSIKKELNLSKQDIVLYFYNPNIHPRSELLERQRAFKKIFKDYQIIIGDWEPRKYLQAIANLDKNDKNQRCPACWQLRLENTFIKAVEKGIDTVSSTLFSSQYQNLETIKKIGNNLAKKYNLKFWIPSHVEYDLHTCGFYKQNYCGCVYSLKERLEEKYK